MTSLYEALFTGRAAKNVSILEHGRTHLFAAAAILAKFESSFIVIFLEAPLSTIVQSRYEKSSQ